MFSDYLMGKYFDQITGNGSYSPVSNLYFGLLYDSDADVSEDMYLTELSSAAYVRQPIQFAAKTNVNHYVRSSNSNTITFPVPDTDLGWYNTLGIFDAQTSGNLLFRSRCYSNPYDRYTDRAWSLFYLNDIPSIGETVTLGSVTYKYIDVLAAPYDVLIGGSAQACVTNLARAIRREAADEGTLFANGTPIHPTCTAEDPYDATNGGGYGADPRTLQNIVVKYSSAGGNGTAISTTCAKGLWFPVGTLQGAGVRPTMDIGTFTLEFYLGDNDIYDYICETTSDWLLQGGIGPSAIDHCHVYNTLGSEVPDGSPQSMTGVMDAYHSYSPPPATYTAQSHNGSTALTFPAAVSSWGTPSYLLCHDTSHNVIEIVTILTTLTINPGDVLRFPVYTGLLGIRFPH